MKNRYQYPTEAAKQKHRYTSTNIDTNTPGIPETQTGNTSDAVWREKKSDKTSSARSANT